jgi:HJR/Mrr/RecB family endonuclease
LVRNWILTLFFNDEQASTYTWIIIPSLYGIVITLIIIFGWRETKSKLSYYAEEPTLETTVQELTKKAASSVSHVHTFKESIRRKYIRESSNIEAIDVMSGTEFENHLKYFFEQQGYTVKTTPASSDNGVDLLIRKNKIMTAVQCKRYSNSVGVSAVQEVYTGASFYNCKAGIAARPVLLRFARIRMGRKA